jgi:hypothetical protein
VIESCLIETIPHERQQYDTVGDWFWEPEFGRIRVLVSDLGDWRMNFCCGVHELIEAALCVRAGITQEDVCRFDELYEQKRQSVLHGIETPDADLVMLETFMCSCIPSEDSEPGEDLHAPYRREHAVADFIERGLAWALRLPWCAYAAATDAASDRWYAAHGSNAGP